MPTTARPHNAITTVSAANTTEPPAVPTASAAASSRGISSSRLLRYRLRMNSA